MLGHDNVKIKNSGRFLDKGECDGRISLSEKAKCCSLLCKTPGILFFSLCVILFFLPLQPWESSSRCSEQDRPLKAQNLPWSLEFLGTVKHFGAGELRPAQKHASDGHLVVQEEKKNQTNRWTKKFCPAKKDHFFLAYLIRVPSCRLSCIFPFSFLKITIITGFTGSSLWCPNSL